MNKLIKLYKGHGTKILGYAQMVVPAVMVIPDLIPDSQMKWWSLAALLLGGATVQRGYTNSTKEKTGG